MQSREAMPLDPTADLVRALERRIAPMPRHAVPTLLAFSAGVSSTLLAAVVRKRGDLTCIVVSTGDSADLAAARVAESYLDYRIDLLRLSPERGLAIARRIAVAEPNLSMPELLDYVPVVAAADRAQGERVLAGLGGPGAPDGERPWLRALRIVAPLAGIHGRRGVARSLTSRAAAALGLPPAFARPPRRPPREGSGIGPALREIAAARGTTVRALVRRTDSH